MFSASPPISEKQEYGKMEIVVERNSGIFGSKRGWGLWWSGIQGCKPRSQRLCQEVQNANFPEFSPNSGRFRSQRPEVQRRLHLEPIWWRDLQSLLN
ncbi:hypothetical protein RchiOBHm_Chr7g0217041 [Rosa chinensis]|uniref:Uncharacterized protein n=1 Tax=Rosa chinensis TaxID=74649 RepID=A0A2P6PBY2_ROSCH|nr:hypothetical protein RchiOBHm_Chr7g0217041 [Rosa chinensis]